MTFTNSLGIYKLISLEELYKMKDLYLPQDVLTVKCFIYPDNNESSQVPNDSKLFMVPDPFRRQCFSNTKFQVEKRSLTWSITKIRKLCNNQKIATICSNNALKETPSLILSFNISNDSNEHHAQIKIRTIISPYEGKRIFVKCKITILSANKIYKHSAEDTHLFSLKLIDDTWIFPSFINIKNLTDGKYFFIDDTLILQCDFAFSCPGTECHVEAPQYAPWRLEINKPLRNELCGSIHHLYTNGDHCDVNIHVDGQTFPAHRLVLCARSPVFNAMFENEMKEKDTNVIEIDDVDPRTLERLLKFLHSDIVDVEMTSEEASNLYKVADKYQVDLLKQQCSISILSTLAVSNVCDVIVLAEIHEDHFLMTAVENFLQYHFNETLNSNEWKKFMKSCPKLSGIVMFKALKSKSFL